jgi:hypothetical protein
MPGIDFLEGICKKLGLEGASPLVGESLVDCLGHISEIALLEVDEGGDAGWNIKIHLFQAGEDPESPGWYAQAEYHDKMGSILEIRQMHFSEDVYRAYSLVYPTGS